MNVDEHIALLAIMKHNENIASIKAVNNSSDHPLSRLDYIAAMIYANWNTHPDQELYPADAVRLAKKLISELDKAQGEELP